MDRKEIKSSNLISVGYDPRLKIMEIEFQSGGVYKYYKVPEKVYNSLLSSNSAGKYFHTVIEENYAFKRVKETIK